ncbi:DUF6387 family protein [Pseudomonas mandelii]|uniref:DUF6387 family protein n=1 Tax=Pseudomonas mandelii TaxID=75612 RepID=UPI00398C9C7D
MAKIDRVKDLPSWFDLENYSQAESFGEKEWFEQLAYRKWLLMNNPEYPDRQTITRPIVEEIIYKDESGEIVTDGALLFSGEVALDSAKAMTDWRKWVRKAASALRDSPFAVEQLDHEFIMKAQPVASMTIGDLQGVLVQGAMAARGSATSSLLEDYIGTFKSEEVRREAVYHRPFAMESITRAAVMVNLGTTDGEIRQGLDAWLKAVRADQQTKAKRQKPSHTNWARYGLLPYLDLLIWAMETDTHIPDRVMSAAISDYDAGEGNLRTTLAPLAADLMGNLSGLQALVAARTRANPETLED